MAITIQVLQTGSITIRPSAYTQPATRPAFIRRLRALTDRSPLSIELPVYVFLISHPEGYILFDAGMSPSCNSPNYFPWWAPGIKMMSELHIKPDEGIAVQLKSMGIEPKDLKSVVISHLHHDHSGGLEDLKGATVLMSREHWDSFKSPLKSAFEGAAPNHWPKNFNPSLLEATGGPIGPFEKSYPITKDGKIVAVKTPGHMAGHISLIVTGDDVTYFLTGDATYSIDLLDKEETDGVNDDPLLALQSVRKIKELARQRPLVVLPSHDTQTKRNLEGNVVFRPSNL